jgi:biotin carboxyl carrier protein
MAKLYTAAQLQELQRLAANNKPLRSALDVVLSGRPQDLGSAQKKLIQQVVNMSPKDFAAAVESRLGLGSKVRSAADLPKPPTSTPAPTPASTPAPAKAPSAASKAGKLSKVAEKKALSALKTVGKVAKPVAAVGEAVNIGNLLLNEDARQEARDYVAGMEDDNFLMRAGKGFLSPSDTIYGVGAAYSDAISSLDAGDQAFNEAAAMEERLAPQRAANQAKGEAREAALEGALSGVEMEALERAAVRNPQLLKEFGAIQTPEQARALYDSAFSEPEPTVDDVVDQRLAAVDAEEPATPASEPVTRGDLDPDMQDMMGTTGVDPDDYDLAGGAKEPEVDYTDEAVGLFKNTHGTEFDPNSKMDREKLEKMRSMLESQGGLGKMSANQFALQVYRNS